MGAGMMSHQERLAQLRNKLKARKGRVGYTANVLEIEAEIKRLETLEAEAASGSRD
jgi:hypothetical protein